MIHAWDHACLWQFLVRHMAGFQQAGCGAFPQDQVQAPCMTGYQ